MKTIKKITVNNMQSSRWNDVPNQFEIETPEGQYFQSYDSTIIFIDKAGQVWLDEWTWEYSVTTGKYRNQFLGEDKKETMKKIKSWEYKVTNLN